MKIHILALALLALLVTGCSTTSGITGAVSQKQFSYMVVDNTSKTWVLNGANPGNFTGVYTRSVDTSLGSDYALWVNCSGNVTSLKYQISPDGNLWMNGSTALAPCLNNATRYEIPEKSVMFMRGYLQTGTVAGTNQSNISMILTAK